MVLEEQLVGFLNPFANILHSLRAYLLPEILTLPQLGNVPLELIAVQVLAPQSVVPFVHGNTVVIDHSSSIYTPLEKSIPLVTVELELQGFHEVDCTIFRLQQKLTLPIDMGAKGFSTSHA